MSSRPMMMLCKYGFCIASCWRCICKESRSSKVADHFKLQNMFKDFEAVSQKQFKTMNHPKNQLFQQIPSSSIEYTFHANEAMES